MEKTKNNGLTENKLTFNNLSTVDIESTVVCFVGLYLHDNDLA